MSAYSIRFFPSIPPMTSAPQVPLQCLPKLPCPHERRTTDGSSDGHTARALLAQVVGLRPASLDPIVRNRLQVQLANKSLKSGPPRTFPHTFRRPLEPVDATFMLGAGTLSPRSCKS